MARYSSQSSYSSSSVNGRWICTPTKSPKVPVDRHERNHTDRRARANRRGTSRNRHAVRRRQPVAGPRRRDAASQNCPPAERSMSILRVSAQTIPTKPSRDSPTMSAEARPPQLHPFKLTRRRRSFPETPIPSDSGDAMEPRGGYSGADTAGRALTPDYQFGGGICVRRQLGSIVAVASAIGCGRVEPGRA